MTNLGHEINPADARRRKIRSMQPILAGAATVAALALSNAAWPGDAQSVAASGSVHLAGQVNEGAGGSIIAVNDDDNTNPSSGDIFTQNAQDQSTA
jgi:hypothetical protein